jgi:hypothetical protein
MRKSLFVTAVLVSSSVAFADADTAYKALRVFGKARGEGVLNQVVELRGRSGMPQPQVWKITAADPRARGGLQEAEVQRGKIISERTPTAKGSAGVPMDLNKLNLDSDGAFTVADQEMRQGDIPFDRVDYLLRASGGGQAPVWTLDLYEAGAKVAQIRIAADSGAVVDMQRLTAPGPTSGTYRSDRDYVDGTQQPPQRGGDTRYSDTGESFRGVDDFFHRLGKRFERRGKQLKGFFSGD